MSKRVVGWFDRLELKHVYEGLYADDEASRRYAINRVAVWKARVMNKLPTAVVCTTELVISQLRDHQVSAGGCLHVYIWEVRLQYSMALIRFVNLITESKQLAQYAQPIHRLAEIQGLPSWMVDLRHDATHASLPTLPVLRRAAQDALLWLKTTFWEQQIRNVEGRIFSATPVYSESDIADFLVEYMQLMFKHVNDDSFKKRKSKRTGGIQNTLGNIESALHSGKSRDMVLKVLCTKGYLDVTQEQIEALSIQEDEIMETAVPQVLVELWRPLLEVVENCGCVELLFTHLVSTMSECAQKGGGSISWNCAWACALMTAASSQKEMKEAWDLSDLFKSPQRINADVLLKVILGQPNLHSLLLLDHFTECFSNYVDNKSLEGSRKLLQVMINVQHVEVTKERTTEPHTVDQLKEISCRKRRQAEDPEGQQKPDFSPWCLDTCHNWSCHLLGSCPGSPMTYSSLTLPDAVDSIQSMISGASVVRARTSDSQPDDSTDTVPDILTTSTAVRERELKIDKSKIEIL